MTEESIDNHISDLIKKLDEKISQLEYPALLEFYNMKLNLILTLKQMEISKNNGYSYAREIQEEWDKEEV